MQKSLRVAYRRYLAVAISVFILIGLVQDLRATEREPLHILLTNDDGFDAPGIRAVYDVLVAAGHNVTLIAPLSNQSGSGLRITTSGVLDFTEQSAGIWSVDGSPADSVLVGLIYHLKDADSVDLVISGANFGQNLGYTGGSGTVAAATIAMYLGIPAIAVSVGLDISERDAVPVRFPSTLNAFAGAADLTLTIVDDLQRSAINTGNLLPAHTMLNVNYPAVSTEELKGVRIAKAARSFGGAAIDYVDTEQSGQLEVKFGFDRPDNEGDSDTDVELFFDGYATIAVLDGDWDAAIDMREDVRRRLPEIFE